MSWYDAVKWCNARSEKEGFAAGLYSLNPAWTTVYRSGQVNLPEANVRWQGAGYRLPTEAEWEKAARGGLAGKRFPFGDTITQSQANYWSTDFERFDVNGAPGPHPSRRIFPILLPVGHFCRAATASTTWPETFGNGAGIITATAGIRMRAPTTDNTHGPTSASWGGDRVYRGGSGVDIAWKSRIANRADAPPRFAMGHFGFRVVLPAGENLVSAESAVFTMTP